MTRQPLKVEVPDQKQESLRFGRVGLIVTLGFAVGVLWPRLAGFKLVPSVPNQASEVASADLSGAPLDSKAAASAETVASREPAEAPPASGPSDSGVRVQVGEPQIVACFTNGKKHAGECGALDFDRLARPRIVALANCAGLEHAEGALSLGFGLDFDSRTIKAVKNGKSTSLSSAAAQAALVCVKREFANLSLAGIEHLHQVYTVFYRVDFSNSENAGAETPPPAPNDPEAVAEASGRATVAWDVALVRASASRDGTVIARVLQGTRIAVTGRSGDWYRIKYDAKGNIGWVYRTAIGM